MAIEEQIEQCSPAISQENHSIQSRIPADFLFDGFKRLARWTHIMSIIEAYNVAWENGDVEALGALIHDDCVFNPHVGGFTMSKSDILGFAGGDNTPQSEQRRILFENDEVGVAHSIVHFSNDSDSEAVMSFMRFKDGQIILMETGATPLSDDYKLIGTE